MIATNAVAAALVGAAALLGASGAAHAGDAKAGRARAQLCQACHGIDGMSKVPDAPNIAGQVEGYLATQLRAFKAGTRKSDAMNLVAAQLSDRDIDDLAAWYASIEVTLGKVPGG
ncbi:MAG TPA: cytochrome c [Casimicrobiaceae bacterium]|nr:cytochrome c [Casimicrobiaceae bacterium]